jgi:hypothetical protein
MRSLLRVHQPKLSMKRPTRGSGAPLWSPTRPILHEEPLTAFPRLVAEDGPKFNALDGDLEGIMEYSMDHSLLSTYKRMPPAPHSIKTTPRKNKSFTPRA